MQNCLTTNVDVYLANNCPQLVAQNGNVEYWSSLFSLFYGNKPDLYTSGYELYFQDLLADMSRDVRVGKFTSSQWLSRCPLTGLTTESTTNSSMRPTLPSSIHPEIQTRVYPEIQTGVRSIESNPYINKICGCYGNYGPCGPKCNEFAIPPIGVNGNVQTCPKNICRIDNLSIYAQNSVLGNVNLDQLCPFCLSPSSCICQINNLSINLESSSIGTLHLNQLCDPVLSSVNGMSPATAVNNFNTTVSSRDQINNSKIKTWLLTVLSIILLILIIVMIFLSFKQPKTIIDVPVSYDTYLLYQRANT